MSDNNNAGGTQNGNGNSTGYSAEYVKELRDEAANWRTKLREVEDKFNKLSSEIESTKKQSTVQEVLTKKGITGINPRWVEIGEGSTPEAAVDKFLKDYPHLLPKENTFTPVKGNNVRPMNTQYDNSNVENTNVSELKAIKKDPIARSKLRDQYRSMLAKNSGSGYSI